MARIAALEVVKVAIARMKALNERRSARGEPTLEFGIGLHFGVVMYGNIGVPERLEGSVAKSGGFVKGLRDLPREDEA